MTDDTNFEAINLQLRKENARLRDLLDKTEVRLRDQFATAALNGMLSSSSGSVVDPWDFSVQLKQDIADAAYSFADKMLKARLS
jgi:hypothetical protein